MIAPSEEKARFTHWFAALRDGKHAACVELIARYQQPLYAYVRRLGFSDADADDVLQETFTAAWRAIRSLRDPRALTTWLFRICRRAAGAHAKAGRDEPHLPDTVDLAHAADPGRRDALEAEEQRDWVLAAVTALPVRQREVIALHYLAGLSLSECADVLEVPSGTAKSRLARGLAELEDRLRGSVDLERSVKSHACDR